MVAGIDVGAMAQSWVDAQGTLADLGLAWPLDFEEAGHFRFWDADELEGAVTKAGFVDVCSEAVFGEPPQAVVVGARRP